MSLRDAAIIFLRCALTLYIFCYVMCLPAFVTAQASDRDSDHGVTAALKHETTHLKGCQARICFAIDGSSAQTRGLFARQKKLVAALIERVSKNGDIEVSVVQYGTITEPISPLTKNTSSALKRLSSASFLNASATAVGGPIVYCDGQLSLEDGTSGNKMVLLGNGRSNFGGDPIVRADGLRGRGSIIFAIAIGDADMENLVKIVGGDRNQVFTWKKGEAFHAIVRKLGQRLCGHEQI